MCVSGDVTGQGQWCCRHNSCWKKQELREGRFLTTLVLCQFRHFLLFRLKKIRANCPILCRASAVAGSSFPGESKNKRTRGRGLWWRSGLQCQITKTRKSKQASKAATTAVEKVARKFLLQVAHSFAASSMPSLMARLASSSACLAQEREGREVESGVERERVCVCVRVCGLG